MWRRFKWCFTWASSAGQESEPVTLHPPDKSPFKRTNVGVLYGVWLATVVSHFTWIWVLTIEGWCIWGSTARLQLLPILLRPPPSVFHKILSFCFLTCKLNVIKNAMPSRNQVFEYDYSSMKHEGDLYLTSLSTLGGYNRNIGISLGVIWAL